MSLYVDTGALVKRYLVEAETAAVRELLGGAEVVATSALTYAEMNGAFSRAVRAGVVSVRAGRQALADFGMNWRQLARIGATAPLIEHAGRLTWQFGLRGHDAVHLASALAFAGASGDAVTLATFDRELWRAARDCGMTPWPRALA